MTKEYDVVVVGAGNAALCAALSAAETGASVLVLEAAPHELRGGNTAFTAGAMRVVYHGVDDIVRLVPDLTDEQIAQTDFGAYTEEDFLNDMARVTEYRCDPELTEILVRNSFPTLHWMTTKGVRFMPIYGRQAFKVNERFRFWGGLTLEAVGGGPGLIESLERACAAAGIDIAYESPVTGLLSEGNRVAGVTVRRSSGVENIAAKSVILASGGFQANSAMRTAYMGPGWDIAKVRGTRFNTGAGVRAALEIGAEPWGQWSGAHAVGWDMNAPDYGDLEIGDAFQKHSYPFGIMINSAGKRFVDEGADFRNYTYAKYGRAILAQPGSVAWQIFDQKVTHLLRDEYRIKRVTRVVANSVEDLAKRIEGMNAAAMCATIEEFNAAVRADIPFDPNVLDGRRTEGLELNKSNWANTLDEGPFEAYGVTCGVTFTFGGVRISPSAEAIATNGKPIPGLYACGEIVGGIFYHNYPGGTGLTCGSVFGKIAGASAGRSVTES